MSTTYTQIQKILASDGVAGDSFGNAVALSTHGHVALVGAPHGTGISANTGSVHVLRFSDHQWVLEQKLFASDGTGGDLFGAAVALSQDGKTALVGANGDTVNGNPFQGSAYVFIKSDAESVWVFQAKLSFGSTDSAFGCSVALSADGNTAAIGAFVTQSYIIFVRNGTSWTQQKQIGPAGGDFGNSVALSASGNTALGGALLLGTGGSVIVHTRTAGIWTQQGPIFTSNDIAVGDRFGNSVSLSADGMTALVGALDKNSNQGAAYVFTLSDTVWSQQYKFLPSDVVAGDQFGSSVALGQSPEGHVIALIGAAGGNKSYIFRRVSDVWTHFQTVRANDSDISVNFGNAVGLAGHGLIGLVGASAFSSSQGSAYFFGADPSFTPTVDSKTSFISFLPQVLIGTIALYTGIVSMFLYNAKGE